MIRIKKRFLYFILTLFVLGESYSQLLYVNSETVSYIDASTYSPQNNVLLLFSGSSVLLYDVNATQITEAKWFQLKGFTKISAAITWTDSQVLIFESNQYQIFDVSKAQMVSQKQEWLGLPKEWNGEIDAAVRWDANTVLFTKGDTFLIYDFEKESYTSYDYFSSWEGWPDNWINLEAIFSLDDSIYFLNDGQAVEYSKSAGTFFAPIQIGFEKE